MILIILKNMVSKIKCLFSTLIILVGLNNIQAQELSIPIDVQLEILPKILSLNKSFEINNPDKVIHVGILFSSKLRSSVKVKREIFKFVNNNNFTIGKASTAFIPVDIDKIKNIEKHLLDQEVDVLYFSPFRGYNVAKITKICKKQKIITFTGVSTFADESDISVGFQLKNHKLQISIDLESAKTEGANFSSRLLSISNVK